MIDDYKEEEDKFTVLSKEKEKEMMDKNSSLLTQLQEAEKERMSSQLKVTFVTSLDDSILKQTQNITLYQTKIPDLIVRLQDTKSMFGILKSEYTKAGEKLAFISSEKEKAKVESDFLDSKLISLLEENSQLALELKEEEKRRDEIKRVCMESQAKWKEIGSN